MYFQYCINTCVPSLKLKGENPFQENVEVQLVVLYIQFSCREVLSEVMNKEEICNRFLNFPKFFHHKNSKVHIDIMNFIQKMIKDEKLHSS